MVTFLMGLQDGLTKLKFPCHLCLWDSRDSVAPYHMRDWPQQPQFSAGRNSIKWDQLIDSQNVLFPPLYLQLGLMIQFVTALHKESEPFKYLQDISQSCLRHKEIRSRNARNSPRSSVELGKLHGTALPQWLGTSWGITRPKYVELVEARMKDCCEMGCRKFLRSLYH